MKQSPPQPSGGSPHGALGLDLGPSHPPTPGPEDTGRAKLVKDSRTDECIGRSQGTQQLRDASASGDASSGHAAAVNNQENARPHLPRSQSAFPTGHKAARPPLAPVIDATQTGSVAVRSTTTPIGAPWAMCAPSQAAPSPKRAPDNPQDAARAKTSMAQATASKVKGSRSPNGLRGEASGAVTVKSTTTPILPTTSSPKQQGKSSPSSAAPLPNPPREDRPAMSEAPIARNLSPSSVPVSSKPSTAQASDMAPGTTPSASTRPMTASEAKELRALWLENDRKCINGLKQLNAKAEAILAYRRNRKNYTIEDIHRDMARKASMGTTAPAAPSHSQSAVAVTVSVEVPQPREDKRAAPAAAVSQSSQAAPSVRPLPSPSAAAGEPHQSVTAVRVSTEGSKSHKEKATPRTVAAAAAASTRSRTSTSVQPQSSPPTEAPAKSCQNVITAPVSTEMPKPREHKTTPPAEATSTPLVTTTASVQAQCAPCPDVRARPVLEVSAGATAESSTATKAVRAEPSASAHAQKPKVNAAVSSARTDNSPKLTPNLRPTTTQREPERPALVPAPSARDVASRGTPPSRSHATRPKQTEPAPLTKPAAPELGRAVTGATIESKRPVPTATPVSTSSAVPASTRESNRATPTVTPEPKQTAVVADTEPKPSTAPTPPKPSHAPAHREATGACETKPPRQTETPKSVSTFLAHQTPVTASETIAGTPPQPPSPVCTSDSRTDYASRSGTSLAGSVVHAGSIPSKTVGKEELSYTTSTSPVMSSLERQLKQKRRATPFLDGSAVSASSKESLRERHAPPSAQVAGKDSRMKESRQREKSRTVEGASMTTTPSTLSKASRHRPPPERLPQIKAKLAMARMDDSASISSADVPIPRSVTPTRQGKPGASTSHSGAKSHDPVLPAWRPSTSDVSCPPATPVRLVNAFNSEESCNTGRHSSTADVAYPPATREPVLIGKVAKHQARISKADTVLSVVASIVEAPPALPTSAAVTTSKPVELRPKGKGKGKARELSLVSLPSFTYEEGDHIAEGTSSASSTSQVYSTTNGSLQYSTSTLLSRVWSVADVPLDIKEDEDEDEYDELFHSAPESAIYDKPLPRLPSCTSSVLGAETLPKLNAGLARSATIPARGTVLKSAIKVRANMASCALSVEGYSLVSAGDAGESQIAGPSCLSSGKAVRFISPQLVHHSLSSLSSSSPTGTGDDHSSPSSSSSGLMRISQGEAVPVDHPPRYSKLSPLNGNFVSSDSSTSLPMLAMRQRAQSDVTRSQSQLRHARSLPFLLRSNSRLEQLMESQREERGHMYAMSGGSRSVTSLRTIGSSAGSRMSARDPSVQPKSGRGTGLKKLFARFGRKRTTDPGEQTNAISGRSQTYCDWPARVYPDAHAEKLRFKKLFAEATANLR